MSLRAKAKLVAMLLASPLVVAPPVWAASGGSGGLSGGAALTGASSDTSAHATPVATAQNGNLVTTATGDGITVATTVSALLGRRLAFTGTATGAPVGSTVFVQRLDPMAGWVDVASGVVAQGGSFSVRWRTNHAGRLTMRTLLEQTASASQAAQSAPTLVVTVYRPAIATIYGAGFFGQKTACGHTLHRATIGVASRTLRCGTLIQIYYGGQTLVVPVIDRGPYANHATWDLTQATADALGITGTETVGTVAG